MCGTSLVVPPLVEPAGHRPLQAVDLSSQSGVPGDLPLLPQLVRQAYLILNACRIGGRGSPRGQHLGVDAARAFKTVPEKFSTHVSIAIPLCKSGSNGI